MVGETEILELMNRAQAVFLASNGEEGPSIRALVNLRRADIYPGIADVARRDGFTVYLTTSRKSRKVQEVIADPRVSLYYSLPERFEGVTLNGSAVLDEDEDLRRALWCDAWRIYWPEGLTDPDYCVLRFTPQAIFGWRGTTPFHYDMAAD